MASLRTFLETLSKDEILRFDEPMELDYTPIALALELVKEQKFPLLWFERPNGFDMPVVANIFANRDRIVRIAGASDAARFNETWLRAENHPIPPRIVDSGPAQEVGFTGDEVDVRTLPISRHFQADAGRYIGSGILICKDPDTGARNLSYQRLQLKGKDRFGASLHSRGHIWDHLIRSRKRGENLEVAVVIGAHPAIYLAAAKVAMEVDELDIAGGLLGKPVDLVKCRTIDIEVPAEAEIVIEGELLAGVSEDEGPYGEYTGYSTYRSTRNVFVVKAVTRRGETDLSGHHSGQFERTSAARPLRQGSACFQSLEGGRIGGQGPQLPQVGNSFSRLHVAPKGGRGASPARHYATARFGFLFETDHRRR